MPDAAQHARGLFGADTARCIDVHFCTLVQDCPLLQLTHQAERNVGSSLLGDHVPKRVGDDLLLEEQPALDVRDQEAAETAVLFLGYPDVVGIGGVDQVLQHVEVRREVRVHALLKRHPAQHFAGRYVRVCRLPDPAQFQALLDLPPRPCCPQTEATLGACTILALLAAISFLPSPAPRRAYCRASCGWEYWFLSGLSSK